MTIKPSFGEAFRYWLKLGFISFGGPTGQIAMMHKEVVEKKKWMDEAHFLQSLNFCMLLPGPEAQQLATYIGWLMHRTWGGIAAGLLFLLPSVFILWGLSYLYAAYGNLPSVSAFFYGLKPAVAAIVAEAVIRIGRKSLKNGIFMSLAAASFTAIYFLKAPFPLIVFLAGLIGYLGGKYSPERFAQSQSKPGIRETGPTLASQLSVSAETQTGWARSIKVFLVCVTIWFLPVILVGLLRGWTDIFIDISVLFSKAALVTFGGAYSVLAYVGQQAVENYGWLQPEQMMDGLGLAETTPGPLIMVNQFVGYMAAYTQAEGLTPGLAGAIGGLLTTWVTFAPSFLLIFLFAPYIEKIRGNIKLGAALAVITAAVVGVILNLGVTFTFHTILPEGAGVDWYALAAILAAFGGMQFLRWGMIPVIIGSALAGYIWKMYVLL